MSPSSRLVNTNRERPAAMSESNWQVAPDPSTSVSVSPKAADTSSAVSTSQAAGGRDSSGGRVSSCAATGAARTVVASATPSRSGARRRGSGRMCGGTSSRGTTSIRDGRTRAPMIWRDGPAAPTRPGRDRIIWSMALPVDGAAPPGPALRARRSRSAHACSRRSAGGGVRYESDALLEVGPDGTHRACRALVRRVLGAPGGRPPADGPPARAWWTCMSTCRRCPPRVWAPGMDLLAWLERHIFARERAFRAPVAETQVPRVLAAMAAAGTTSILAYCGRLGGQHRCGIPGGRGAWHPGDHRRGDDGPAELRRRDPGVGAARSIAPRERRARGPLGRSRGRSSAVCVHAPLRGQLQRGDAARVGRARPRARARCGRRTCPRMRARWPRSRRCSRTPGTTSMSTTGRGAWARGRSSRTPSTCRTGSWRGWSRPRPASPTAPPPTCSSRAA